MIINKKGSIVVATAEGPVDQDNFEEFKDKLDSICSESNVQLILDCSDLNYLNSRSIGLLIRYHRSITLKGGRFAMAGLNAKMLRTLELLNLGGIIEIYDTTSDALAAFGASDLS